MAKGKVFIVQAMKGDWRYSSTRR